MQVGNDIFVAATVRLLLDTKLNNIQEKSSS